MLTHHAKRVFDQYSLTPENDTGKSMRSMHADYNSTDRIFDFKQDVVLAEHTQSNPAGTVLFVMICSVVMYQEQIAAKSKKQKL
jgi:hypothetical protein